jgi:hypothetical protein
MKTTSRRVCALYRKNKPSRSSSGGRSRVYVARPPKDGWPAFTGDNWGALGLKNKGNK